MAFDSTRLFEPEPTLTPTPVPKRTVLELTTLLSPETVTPGPLEVRTFPWTMLRLAGARDRPLSLFPAMTLDVKTLSSPRETMPTELEAIRLPEAVLPLLPTPTLSP